MKNYQLLLFDLDGTLTESAPGIIQSISYALEKLGITEDNRDRLYSFIGPPLKDSFQTTYNLSDEKAWQAVIFYREYFADRGMFENSLYEGIPELLQKLLVSGYTLAVVTSKPQVYAEKILDHFGMTQYFHQVIGSHLDGSRMDKAELISWALQCYPAIPRHRVLMVGDRRYDLEGARANGVDAAAAGYGYGSREELLEAKPRFFIESAAALQKILL